MKKTVCILIMLFTFSISKADAVNDVIAHAEKLADSTYKKVNEAINKSGDAIQSAIPDSAELTFARVYSDMKVGLSALAQTLKVGVEHVYGVLVMQQVVYAITSLLICVMFLVAAVIAYKQSRLFYKKHRENGVKEIGEDKIKSWDLDDSPNGVISVICTIAAFTLSITCVVMFTQNMTSIVSGFVNPEYGAIKDIISFVK